MLCHLFEILLNFTSLVRAGDGVTCRWMWIKPLTPFAACISSETLQFQFTRNRHQRPRINAFYCKNLSVLIVYNNVDGQNSENLGIVTNTRLSTPWIMRTYVLNCKIVDRSLIFYNNPFKNSLNFNCSTYSKSLLVFYRTPDVCRLMKYSSIPTSHKCLRQDLQGKDEYSLAIRYR